MKEAFEKIKERLEETKKRSNSHYNYGEETSYKHAIEIVDQVAEETNKGEISDGYHTFNELYHHRAVLFAVICNSNKEFSWKSMLHDTGNMYDGMFIVGIETPEGQATYHYDINPYWDMFNVKELPKAPKWDGHTPDEAIRRIATLAEECATDTNARSRKLLDSLHEKILKSKFAEEVTEAEIEALLKAKELTNNNQSLTNDGLIALPKEAFDRMIARMESESERDIYEEESLFVNVRDAGRIIKEIAAEYQLKGEE